MSLDIWLAVTIDAGGPEPLVHTVDDRNYTHNVTPMWHAAGVYEALYESDGKTAGEVIAPLERGVADMRARPEHYITMNPSNGWGSYETALPWLEEFLAACRKAPRAVIGVSR